MVYGLLAADDLVINIVMLAVLCVLLLVPFAYLFYLERVNGKARKNVESEDACDNFQIKIRGFIIGFVALFVVFFGVFSILCPALYIARVPDYISLGETVIYTCCFGGGAIIFATVMVALIRWRVIIAGDRLIRVPFIGKRREYLWSDITKVVTEQPEAGRAFRKIYVNGEGKPLFSVNIFMSGGEMLTEKLKKTGKIYL